MSVPDQETDPSGGRLCDFCNESKALLYCRADSAKLCFSCDREVHSTNQLFQKHTRCLLCDSCNSSPSSIFCSTDSAVLCQNCDWETHKQFGSIHDRRPLEGFSGCPSVSELLNCLGFDDLGKKSLVLDGGNDEELMDFFVWETPSFVSLDDLIVSGDRTDSDRSFQALGVPPLPKNRNATCGKHKEEILCQLREMAKTEPNFDGLCEELEVSTQDQSQVPGKYQLRNDSRGSENNPEQTPAPSYEPKWSDYTGGVAQDEGFSSNFIGTFIDMNHLVPDKDSDIGDSSSIANCLQEFDPVDVKPFQVPLMKAVPRELNSQERDSAISRYKEKKKTRRYEKQIRYESRKVRAEGRTRIKGRFAKMDP